MVSGRVVTRGTETFQLTIRTVMEALSEAGRKTAKSEINEALVDLSRRPNTDLTGATTHAMAALECVMRDACEDAKPTLRNIASAVRGSDSKTAGSSNCESLGICKRLWEAHCRRWRAWP